MKEHQKVQTSDKGNDNFLPDCGTDYILVGYDDSYNVADKTKNTLRYIPAVPDVLSPIFKKVKKLSLIYFHKNSPVQILPHTRENL